jgi:hypothetical protein
MLDLIELLFRLWIHPGRPVDPKPIGPERWKG